MIHPAKLLDSQFDEFFYSFSISYINAETQRLVALRNRRDFAGFCSLGRGRGVDVCEEHALGSCFGECEGGFFADAASGLWQVEC
jgi:hypothetical protein